MDQHYEVRILPNGHPMIYIPHFPPFPTPPASQAQLPPSLPVVPPTPPLPQPLLPQPLPTQLATVPQSNIVIPHLVPIEQLLNPNGLPISQPMGLGSNPMLDMLQYPLLAPGLNPYMTTPLGMPFVQFNHPPPLMSLRVSTPPAMRMHPYQREAMLRRQRQRNNSQRAASRSEHIIGSAVNHRPSADATQDTRRSTPRRTSDTEEPARQRN